MKKSFALFVIFGVLTACQYEVTIPETPFKVSVQTYNAERVSAVNATLKAKADFGKSGPYGLEMGFQYSTSADIPASNSTTVEVENAEGTDVYSTVITGLDPLTTYYFRSFIRKDGQDTYGTIKTFTTMSLASLLTCFDAFLTGGDKINADPCVSEKPFHDFQIHFIIVDDQYPCIGCIERGLIGFHLT